MPKMISRWFPTSLEYEEDTVTLCQNCVNKFDKYCQDISKNITNEYVKKLSGRLMRKLHKSKIDVGTRKLLNKSLLAGALDPEVLGIKAGDGPVTGWVSGLERRCEGDGLSPPQYNISVIRRNFRFLKKLTDGAKRFPVPYRVQVTVGDNLFSKKQQVPHAAYLGYGSPLLKTKLRQKALRLAQKRNRTSSLGFQKKIIRRDFQREFASMAQSQKHYKSIATLVGARHALIGMKGQYGIVFDKPARSALDVLVDDEERDRKAVQAMFRGMNKLGKLQVALDRFIERTKPRVMEFFAPKRAPGGKDA